MNTEYEPTNSQLLEMREEIIEKLSRREVLKSRSFPGAAAATAALILLLAVVGIRYQNQENLSELPHGLVLKSGSEEAQSLCRLKIYSFEENKLVMLHPDSEGVSRPEADSGVFVPVLNCTEAGMNADITVSFDGVQALSSEKNTVLVPGADQELCLENRTGTDHECGINYVKAEPGTVEITVRARIFPEGRVSEVYTQTIIRSSRK